MGEFAFLYFIILTFMSFSGFLARLAFAYDLNRRASVDQPLPRAKCLHEEVLEYGSYSCEEAEKLLCSASSNVTSHFEKFGSVHMQQQWTADGGIYKERLSSSAPSLLEAAMQ